MPSTAYAQDHTGNQVFADVTVVRWGHTAFGGALNAPTAAPSSVENECGHSYRPLQTLQSGREGCVGRTQRTSGVAKNTSEATITIGTRHYTFV